MSESSRINKSITIKLADVELEGIISQIITFNQVTNLQSHTLRDRIKNMLKIIEQEIEKQ